MALTATITRGLRLQQTDYVGGGRLRSIDVNEGGSYTRTLTSAANDTTIPYYARIEIEASGNASFDLSGALEDLFGNEAVFTSVHSLQIINISDAPLPIEGVTDTATEATITVDGNWITNTFGASAAFTMNPGCGFQWGPNEDGVINSSADTITITNNSSTDSAYVEIMIVGADMS